MPIIFNAKAANGITVGFHKAVKLEVDLERDIAIVSVSSFTDEQSYLEGLPIAWMWNINIPVNLLSAQGTLLEDIETALVEMETSPFLLGQIVIDGTLDLSVIKSKKLKEINRSRLAANQSFFEYQGEQIAFDQLSFIDIMSTNGYISLTNQMPPDWLGGWLTKDGSFIPIGTVEEWIVFYTAMYQKGRANFLYSQSLKAQLQAAQTVPEIESIIWNQ